MTVPGMNHNRKRAPRRALPAALLVLAALAVPLAAAPAAGAHAVVRPAESRPADLQEYTLTVPNEKQADTNSVAVQVPDGITFLIVRPVPGWKTKLEHAGGRISVMRWTGGRIPPDGYENFHWIARNPVRAGALTWKTVQGYASGAPVRWVGPPDSDAPAAQTTLAEDVTPQDIVNVEGGKSSAASPPPATATSGSKDSTDDDGNADTALVLAIVALAVAVGALVAAMLGRVRRRAA